ncbi:MAG TPA: urea ABC transporter substrate-binding protein [Accumulibacter sp.]|nr:urea ABC transporter substrate-binding protein [Accumulibacter sp.]HMW16619.1 urea ABC transporter substrate-binding protein [Accumulibacter sp.]HMX22317.1 urea ABC transporter substrate-binding protein [Accumulibacter sp.]HMY05487.1 urea ABC transporter substrate-binding protein [Accumulibacter sp.]HNC16687.1 urea ABC transporter substrate-binding protein [Accumulibacter sp.]
MGTPKVLLVWLTLMVVLLGGVIGCQRQKPAALRIGVIHSLTGTMALNETPLVNAIRLAVEEINSRGGLLGREVEMVLADSRSDATVAAAEAERLITTEGVSVLFACWTSACRLAVKPVVERHHHLLFYPVQYEGMEQSPNILYTGSAPNQQVVPGTAWALREFGKRVYLLGSDYVFPRTANMIIRDLVKTSHGQIVGERYVPLGEQQELGRIVAEIAAVHPDVVLNTLNGDSNGAFFDALVAADLLRLPILSFSVPEDGMKAWGGGRFRQHFVAWSYFHSLPEASNRDFIKAYQSRFGADQYVTDPAVASYVGVLLWAQTVKEVGTADPQWTNGSSLLRQSVAGPDGVAAVDARTRHLWKRLLIGRVQADGQFTQLFTSQDLMRPSPWPVYRSRAEWQALLEQTQR